MSRNDAGRPSSVTPVQPSAPAHQESAAAGELPLDLHSALRVVQDAERSARRGLTGNTALVYLLWGLTWLIGYGSLWGSKTGWLPLARETALVVLSVAVAAATVSTVVIFARGSRGVRGQSAFQGGMYGAAWGLGFTVMGALSAVIGREIDDFWLRGMLINSIAVLIVGLLYITGGTTFNDKHQAFLGVWLLLVTVAGLASGPDHFLTVFFFLGSTGMLLAALVEFLRTRRHRTAASHA